MTITVSCFFTNNQYIIDNGGKGYLTFSWAVSKLGEPEKLTLETNCCTSWRIIKQKTLLSLLQTKVKIKTAIDEADGQKRSDETLVFQDIQTLVFGKRESKNDLSWANTGHH